MANSSEHEEYGYDLGSYHRPVSTTNQVAQIWFDRGLIWAYAFNHEEAVECFEKAITSDPDCAMAYWGLAYSLGPNYNKPWDVFDDQDLAKTVDRAHRATDMARTAASAVSATSVERALIEALQFRYPQDRPVKECSVWNEQYANALKSVYQEQPDDLDVATLYADALMNLTPWQLWDLRTGDPAPGASTLEAKHVLERAFTHNQQQAFKHPGALHMYIHLMEMSQSPEAALPIANHLRGLVPDGGHLHHMPTHLDVLCGDYQQAIVSNARAIEADEKFSEGTGALKFYTLYRVHDYHFLIYAAMFAGQFKMALETVSKMEASIPESLLRVKSPPMADWLEGFLAMRVHVLVRFGRWKQIIDLDFPSDQGLYCTTIAFIHYAKGVAYAALGLVKESEEHQRQFNSAKSRVGSTRTVFNNTCRDILAVAEQMLTGELEYRKGNIPAAFEHLQNAIVLEDSLPYDEPWGWMQPVRHAYGALLLEQGRVEDAAKAYAADLGVDGSLPRARQHPANVWALQGYHECLVKLGRDEEAHTIEPQLRKAASMADIPVKTSCFCRQSISGRETS